MQCRPRQIIDAKMIDGYAIRGACFAAHAPPPMDEAGESLYASLLPARL